MLVNLTTKNVNPMRIRNILFTVLALIGVLACSTKTPIPPSPLGPLPTAQQLAWHEMEYYAFIHFSMNTFTDKEWGFGDENPKDFNPSNLDCRQWARICKAAGMKGIVLTTKHHDGFCLWPFDGTDHSVKNSPWRNGQGNLLKEVREACDEYGLKLGLYLSPWDRNHSDYVKPEYITYFRNQLKDILSNYGEIFEVWFDGANGGDGYYGGANESRTIDKKTYYAWEETCKLVLELQPNAIIFSDAGPGARWIGNERGYAGKTNWCTLNPDKITVGETGNKQQMLNEGDENGTHWIPGETDVSIRPGWFYHESEDERVKTLEHLLDIYYGSVGRNSNLLLNIPIDRRGQIHENDSAALMDLRTMLDRSFAENLSRDAKASASNVRGNHQKYQANNAIDNNKNTYWATDDSVIQSTLTIDFDKVKKFNRFLVQEYIPLGQRVKAFIIEAFINGKWEFVAEATTIGYKRILCFPMVESKRLRLKILDAKVCPLISNIEVCNAPEMISNPKIVRDKMGMVSMSCKSNDPKIFYTLDGSTPTKSSLFFQKPFALKGAGTIKAIAMIDSGEQSDECFDSFDICKEKWSIFESDSYHPGFEASLAIDGKPSTMWHTNWGEQKTSHPHSLQVDMGEELELKGFTYTPRSDNSIVGVVTKYNFNISKNGTEWQKVISYGEFSNIANNPMKQEIRFLEPVKARYISIEALAAADKQDYTSINEIGVLTK